MFTFGSFVVFRLVPGPPLTSHLFEQSGLPGPFMSPYRMNVVRSLISRIGRGAMSTYQQLARWNSSSSSWVVAVGDWTAQLEQAGALGDGDPNCCSL